MSSVLRHVLLLLLLPAILILAGCDSNDDADDNGNGNITGTFSAEITGQGIDESLTGLAWFGTYQDEETQETFFAIWMTPTAPTTSYTVALLTRGSRPGTGNYPIVDASDENFDDIAAGSFGGLAGGGATATYFVSTGGSVQVSTSNSSRMAGTFTFTAAGVIFQNEVPTPIEVSVTGTFNAVQGPDVQIPGL